MSDAVLCSKQAGHAAIVINRPEKRNALNMEVATGVLEFLRECEADPELRLITLTGAGDVAFCAGNDLAEFQKRADHPGPMREFDQTVLRMHEAIRKSNKVVLALVNGFCLGGGITLLGACDLAIASDRAEFGHRSDHLLEPALGQRDRDRNPDRRTGVHPPGTGRLGDHLADAASAARIKVVRGGTYLVMEGPQFSTKAESALYRSWGCDVIGMTNMPEAKLAREAEICYASVAMVTGWANASHCSADSRSPCPPRARASFVSRLATGAVAAIPAAMSSTSSRKDAASASNTRETSPSASASSSATRRPVSSRSRAAAAPTTSGKRKVPAMPGCRPSFTNGAPIRAPRAAKRRFRSRLFRNGQASATALESA